MRLALDVTIYYHFTHTRVHVCVESCKICCARLWGARGPTYAPRFCHLVAVALRLTRLLYIPQSKQAPSSHSIEVQLGISEVDATFDDVGTWKSVTRFFSSFAYKPIPQTVSTYPVPRLHTRSLIA
jgi:hypothetical protein